MILYLGKISGFDTTNMLKNPWQFLDCIDIDKNLAALAIKEVYATADLNTNTALKYTLHHNFYARLNESKYATLLAMSYQKPKYKY